MFEHKMKIANGLKAPIWCLTKRNRKFGTGFDLKRDEGKVTLGIMDDCSKYGSVILTLSAESDSESEFQFIHDIVSKLEKQVMEIR